MKLAKALVFGGMVTTAALGTVAPAIAYCPPSQPQAVVRINNPAPRVQRITNVNGTRTVIQQRTVIVPVNRAW